ncbi:MAG TPA: ABC transporter permease [Acidimicrobiia bacterium]|nr:ABC transporter permease [Acidimicrobiia bacterium]
MLLYLTLRELRSRYRRTVLGWTWSLLNPLATALIFAAVFGSFFKVEPPPGVPSGVDTFWVFLLVGLLPWSMFSVALNTSIDAIVGNSALIHKVKFRRSALVTSACIAASITLLIELAVATVLITIFERPMVLAYAAWVPLIVVLQLGFCVGLSLILASLNVYFRDVQYLMGIVLLAWFYLTPIVYPITIVPEHWVVLDRHIPALELVELNPMTRFVTAMREVMYDMRSPSLATLLELLAIALVSLVVGAYVFRRLEGRFAEEL